MFFPCIKNIFVGVALGFIGVALFMVGVAPTTPFICKVTHVIADELLQPLQVTQGLAPERFRFHACQKLHFIPELQIRRKKKT